MFGWAPEELHGEPIEHLLPSRLADRHTAHRAGHRLHPTPRPMASGLKLSARRRDGSEFPVEISLAPVRSRRGPLVIATVVDITARTNLQEQLEQANAKLRRHADELELHGREMSLLAQMGELLESCQSLDEAYGEPGWAHMTLLRGAIEGASLLFCAPASGYCRPHCPGALPEGALPASTYATWGLARWADGGGFLVCRRIDRSNSAVSLGVVEHDQIVGVSFRAMGTTHPNPEPQRSTRYA